MTGFRELERSTLRVEHVVRATHASTGQPIGQLDATWVGRPPPGRLLKVIGGTVVVSVDERYLPPAGAPPPAAPPAIPRVNLAVRDLALSLRLAAPTVEVALDAPVKSVDFEPLPMTLTVDLVRPGVGPTGGPSTGRTVEARATNATRIPLPEVAGTPGTYRSTARVWTAGFNPLDLLVGNTLVRRVAIDFARSETRITVVDPT